MKKFMFKALSTIFVIALLALMTACGGTESAGDGSSNGGSAPEGNGEASGGLDEKIVIKFGHHLADTHSLGEQVTYFAELVDEKSNGVIEIDIYSNGQLGDQRELLEGLQMGTVDMSLGDTGVVANYATDVGVLDLPYIYDDIHHTKRALDGELGDRLKEAILEASGIRTLVIEPVAYRDTALVESKKVESFDDFKGLKLRTLEAPQIVDAFMEFGVQPVALPTGEALSSMQTGVVDGLESNAEFLSTINIWEIAKYWVETHHNMTQETINISEKLWQKLPQEAQNIIVEALDESSDWYFELAIQKGEESLEKFKENGMEFIEMDITPFMEAAQPTVDKFVKDHGLEEYMQLIEDARE